MCGDSLHAAEVARLTQGETVQAIVADPPYDLDAGVVRQAFDALASVAVVLCNGAIGFDLCREDWQYGIDFVWHHRQPRSWPTPYQPVFYHNNILVMTKGKAKSGWHRPEPGFGSVIELEGVEYVDTAMGHGKSVALFVEMIRGFDHTLWADPFLGTGASLLAVLEQGKRLLGMEREAKILATALQRFEDAGLTPERED